MNKRKYLKKLEKSLSGVPARERDDLISYYDELIEDSLERGKSAREVFSDLEAPEVVAENYLRDRAEGKDDEKKRGYHVRKTSRAIGFFGGIFAALASVVLAALVFSFAVSSAALALSGIYVLVLSFGLLFSGRIALFFAQLGMAVALFALAILFEVLTSFLAKTLAGMWRLVTGRAPQNKSARKQRRTLIAGCAMFLAGCFMFTAAFGALGFDDKNLAVADGLVVHEETIELSDSFSLQTDTLAVTVARSDDETCRLVYRDLPEVPRTFALEGGTAVLTVDDGAFSAFGASIGMQWRRGILIGAVSDDLHRAELYLPASFTGDLTVQVDAGTISISDMVCSDLVVETKTGRIDLCNITAETVTAETETGAVSMKNVACARVRATTVTGAVTFSGLCADSIVLRTTTGAVRGTIAGREADYAVEAEVGTGACNLHEKESGEKRLEVRVVTGSVEVSFEG